MRKFIYITIQCFFLLSCNTINNLNNAPLAEEKTAPFCKVDFKGDEVFVTLDDQEYQWLMLDTIEVADIVDQFEEKFEDEWKKRFSEDLVEYLNKLNIYPKRKDSFTLKNENDEVNAVRLKFYRDKRTEAKDHFEATYDKDIDINLILSPQAAKEDLDQLQNLIQNKYSYFFLNDVAIKEEIQLLKDGLTKEISTYELAFRIGKFLNKFGDGHTRIHNVSFKENGVLPFSVTAFNGKVVCTKDGALLSDEHPYLHSINGIGVANLLASSKEYLVSNASPQFKEYLIVSRLSRIGEILKINGSNSNKLSIELASADGETISIVQDMEEYKTRKEMSQTEMSQMIEKMDSYNPFEVKQFDEIGYFRIKSMDALSGDDPKELPIYELQNAKGLIIDVRNNGGGLRDILIELAPHFINKKQEYIVGNVARLRTNSPEGNHDLSDRYLYQLGDVHFENNANYNLKSWSSNFSQSILLSDSIYSPPYYLYIQGHENPKFADIPVVVLMNEGCYSATDIFLSSFKEIDDVTLIGTASGGGSGRSKRYKLNNSLIEIRLSSIVSFQPNGDLYDGVGVHPDIIVKEESISDILNKTDSQLEFAMKFLSEKIK